MEPDVGVDLGALAAQACHEPVRSAWSTLRDTFDKGIVCTLRDGAGAHREAMEAAGLTAAAPASWEDRSEALLDYRRRIASDLFEPLGRAYRKNGPTSTVFHALERGLAGALDASRSLEKTVEAPWLPGALGPKPSDGIQRRTGKFFARGLSSARKVGRTRPAPLRSVVLEHLYGVVAPGEDEATRASMAAWAEWSQRLETAIVEWGDAALPALIRAERVEKDDSDDAWRVVGEAALTLDAALATLHDDAPLESPKVDADARLGVDRDALEAELAVAGSFLSRAREPIADAPALTRATRVAPAFDDWDQRIGARIDLTVALLAILSGATAVQRRIVWRFRDSCAERVTALPPIADVLEEWLAALAKPTEGPALARELKEMNERFGDLLPPAVSSVADTASVENAVRVAAESTVETLMAMVRQAPAALVLHAENAGPPTGARKAESRTVPFQELARQSFDALRVERIRAAAYGFVEALTALRDTIAELPAVFTFAYEAATKELEGDAEDADAKAVGLVSEALRSIADSLRSQVEGFDAAVGDARARFASEICDGSAGLLDRIAAGRMQARLLHARSRAADLRAWINERWGPPVDRTFGRLVHHAKRLRRLASRGLRKGSAIVGGPVGERAASARTLRILANPKALTDRLPLVYQRLFTFDPIAEPALLAGRERELDDAMARWARWRTKDGIPIVVRGRQGSGVTSFMHVLCARIEEDGGEVLRIGLDERVTDEAGLAALLSEALGLSVAGTLADLAAAIFEADLDSLSDAVALDDLEHLYLRVPGGTDLVERTLTLMAETEPRIFWIGGVTTSAWQLIATAEPTAISQVDLIDLHNLDASDIRTVLTSRHRRSGLPVHYEEPQAGRRMLRRRLRRMRDPEAFQGLLEDDFFDRIEKASAGYLRLALFQWLQSADFEAGDGLLMRAPERPDFSVLDSLDMTQNFTLKAFLEHRTLTLAEHDRIFRVPRQESYQIFESLGNRHLITPVTSATNGEAPERSEVEEDLRYEVEPLLVGAVITHLRSRNIVH